MSSHKRYVWRRLVQTGVEVAAAAGTGLVAADAEGRGGGADRVPPPEGLLGPGAAPPVASTRGRRPQRHQHHHQDDAQQVGEQGSAVHAGFLRAAGADRLGHVVQTLRERGGGQIDAEGVVEAGTAVQVQPLEAHREVLGRRPRQTLARSHFGRAASLQSSLFSAI